MNRFSLFPSRRFLAVDVGSRCIKALLVSRVLGRLRIHAHRVIGLDETTQPGTAGWPRVLNELKEELGNHPLVISVPQHASDSQVLDLPGADERTIHEQIQEDVVQLSGLTESAIIYDYGRLAPFGQYSNPYWVTHAREGEVLAVVRHFEPQFEEIWEITSTANALVAAYLETRPEPANVLLVDLGSAGTEVVIVHQGQGVYMTSFAVGGLLFSEQIRAERQCPSMEAEFSKNTEDLLSDADEMPALRQLVDRWHGELVRILEDWLGEHPTLNVPASGFEVILSGGECEMPGLVGYLRANSILKFRVWSDLPGLPAIQPAGQFAVAHGLAAKVAHPQVTPSTSLVSDEMRAARKEHGAVQLLHAGTWLVLAITVLVLGFGTWQKLYLIGEAEDELSRAKSVLALARQTDRLKLQLAAEYEEVRPVLIRQQQSLHAVETLAALLNYPLPTNSWFVLFADAESYYTLPPLPPPTNAPPVTNAFITSPMARLTNAFIAEFSTSLDAANARFVQSGMIDDLKKNPLFRKVDILSPDQRRRLVKDDVLVPESHYALSFTMTDNDFLKPFLSAEEIRRLDGSAERERTNALGRATAGPKF